MLPPRPAQNVSKNQPRTSSSKPTKNISKPRCEAWIPLNGWEQGDDAESDIYYLAIDAWAKRNSKIKTDAPKGVPSSKLWEPFLCTTVQQCSGIIDFEAFVNVSLSLHKSIAFDEEAPEQNETTNLKKDLNQTSRTEGDSSASNRTKINQNKIKAEPLKKGDDQSAQKESDRTTSVLLDKKINGHTNRTGNDHSNTKQTDNSEQHGQEEKKDSRHSQVPIVVLSDADEFLQKDDCPGHLDIVNDSPPPPEGGGDGVELDNESILEWMARNGTSHSAPVSRTQQREPLKKRGRSAKTKSAEDILRRAALNNATKSKVNTKKVSVPANPVKISYMHSGNVRIGIPNGDPPVGEALDNTEVSISETTPSESQTGDPARRTSLENRLLIEEVVKENSKKIEYMPKTTIVSIGDLLSSAPRLERRQQNNGRDSLYPSIENEDDGTSSRESFGSWTSPRPSEDLRSPSSSSLPPVPVTTKHNTPPREIHSSNSPRSDRLKTVNLNPAKIPVISYRKGARRRDVEDNRDVAHNLEDTRHIKRLIKSALSRESSRVHSAGSIRQRGPPAFRPQSFKTPLQRAVENAHKKIYGNHYYLFNNNNSTATGMEHGDDERRTSTEVAMKGRRSQSAHGETTNAYVWKENIEAQQRQKRKSLLHFSESISYSGTERVRGRTTNGHGRDGGYKVSDFKPNFKVDTLKTDRRKTIQR